MRSCLRIWAATALWMVMFSTAPAQLRVVDIHDAGWLDALSS